MSHAQQRSVNDSAQYRIDQSTINPLDNTIVRDGEQFKVSPRAIQALAYLIDNAGRPVTYLEMNEAIWQGGCSENSFYQQIATLRKALGDDSSQPRYIKTIAKQGYMFVGIDSVELPERKDSPQLEVKPLSSRLSLPVKELIFALAVVFAAGVYWLLDAQDDDVITISETASDIDPRASMYPLLDLLRQPSSTVVLLRPDPSIGTELQRSLTNALILLTQYQLTTMPDQQVALIPRFERTGVDNTSDFYNKVLSHYESVAPVSYILVPSVIIENDHATYTLAQVDSESLSEQVLFQWSQPRDVSAQALQKYEQDLFSVLQPLGVLHEQPALLLNNSVEATGWFVAAAEDFFKAAKTRKDLEDTIRFSQKSIETNPGNLLAYSLLWAETVRLLSIYSDYDIDAILQRIEESKMQALKYSPEYYRALLVDADSHCWVDEFDVCAAGMARALQQRPFDSYSLDSLYWNLAARPDLQLKVAKHNYFLNPFYYDAFAAYRDALLTAGSFHELSDLIHYHSQWSDSRDWFVQAQSETSLDQLRVQASHYRQRFTQKNQELYGTELLPSRYIGYSLLNANQPELARFWARNGMERDLPFFDLRVIELMANIWQGDWQPLSWQVERAYVMERHKDQNSLDKLTIAYFDLQTGWLSKAAAVFEELAPSLKDKDVTIDSGNLRLFVYYSEIQKRNGNLKYASRAGAAIKAFLQARDPKSPRGIDFGIADAEYYALNNDRERALQQLELAVHQQGWLPNSLWLWPPLEQNMFLKSLRQEPRFKALVEDINSRLAQVCFEAQCS